MDVRRSIVQPLFDASVNILGSLNLIECAKQFGLKRVVYISTGGAVYGEPDTCPVMKRILSIQFASMAPASIR